MNITPNKLSIAQLFATPNEQFIVPSYQRRYAWGYNQYVALFEDIDMLKANDGHLFGMIILHTDYHNGGINQPEIVDGQQRMTTLLIFLKAFEYVYRNKGKSEKADEIKKMISCKGLDEVVRPKLVLGDLDNADMEMLVLGDGVSDFTNNNIEAAFNDYVEWLSALNIEELNLLFYKLTSIAVIIRLDVAMAQDAYKLFETINNRGLKLTPTDIIKNFLLGHAAKIGQEQTLRKVKSIWSNIIINLDEIDSDDFLRQYICSILHRKITKSKLVLEFKKYYLGHVEQADLLGEYEYYQDLDGTDDTEDDVDDNDVGEETTEDGEENANEDKFNILEFLQRLEQMSAMYRKISLGTHNVPILNRNIRNLNNILSKPSYIFLMHFLIEEQYSLDEKQKVLDYIETLMLRRHICERRTSENDDMFAKMVPFVGQSNILSQVRNFIVENEYMPSDSEFEECLPKHQFKGRLIDRAKYILERIEYHKRGNTNELRISSNSEVHLEHIIPQTIHTRKSKQEYGDWTGYLGDRSVVKHKKYVNYIGNMTLLGELLNIQAGNNPFAKKKGSYRKSSFLITQKLATQNDFKFSHVDKRSEDITKIAVKIWQI